MSTPETEKQSQMSPLLARLKREAIEGEIIERYAQAQWVASEFYFAHIAGASPSDQIGAISQMIYHGGDISKIVEKMLIEQPKKGN